MRGEREKEIIRALEEWDLLTIQDLTKNYCPKASAYYILNKLVKSGQAEKVDMSQNGKRVIAFKLVEKKAPDEEVKMYTKFLKHINQPEVRKEAAKDLMALALNYETVSMECIDFLIKRLNLKSYVAVQEYLYATLVEITKKAKAKGFNEVIDRVNGAADKVLEIAKDIHVPPELRRIAWELLILIEDPRITEASFELLTRENGYEEVIDFVKEEIKRYYNEDPLDAKKKLYNLLLKLKKGTHAYQRIIYLLQAIRYPKASINLKGWGWVKTEHQVEEEK